MSTRTPERGRVRSTRTRTSEVSALQERAGRGITRTRTSGRPAPSVRGRRIPQAQESGITVVQRMGSLGEAVRKVPFVAVVMLLVVAGITFTLFLSGRSTEDTYALRAAQQYNDGLVEKKEQLLTTIEGERSAESLAQKAQDLGLVQVLSAPIVVRNPDGTTRMEGDEAATLGGPVAPLQGSPAPAPGGDDRERGSGDRFGLPPGTGGAERDSRGGLSLPYPNGGSPVPDLGAGRRVDTPPAPVGQPPVEPPAVEEAPAPAPAPAPPAAEVPAPVPAPADAPQPLAPVAPPAQ